MNGPAPTTFWPKPVPYFSTAVGEGTMAPMPLMPR